MNKGCGSGISQIWASTQSQLARQRRMEVQIQALTRCLAVAPAFLKAKGKIIKVRRKDEHG